MSAYYNGSDPEPHVPYDEPPASEPKKDERSWWDRLTADWFTDNDASANSGRDEGRRSGYSKDSGFSQGNHFE